MPFADLRTLTLLRIFRSRFSEDAAFLLAVTLAAGFYTYEASLPLAEIIMQVLTVSMIIIWLWLSFTSGFMRRIHFLAFTLTYWLIPQLVIFGYAPSERFNPVFHSFSLISEYLVRNPLDFFSRLLNINPFVSGMGLLVLCLFMFVFGFILRGKCYKHRWYRVFREQYSVK